MCLGNPGKTQGTFTVEVRCKTLSVYMDIVYRKMMGRHSFAGPGNLGFPRYPNDYVEVFSHAGWAVQLPRVAC